jgi:hypothetical protein
MMGHPSAGKIIDQVIDGAGQMEFNHRDRSCNRRTEHEPVGLNQQKQRFYLKSNSLQCAPRTTSKKFLVH